MTTSSEPTNSPYEYAFSQQAKDDLEALSPKVKKAIGGRLKSYLDSGDPMQFAKPLTNAKQGTYRFRVGDYRLPFDMDGRTIIILRVRNRRDVYRR